MSGSWWTGKAVLVTGAGGFIGSHLTETLVARGARVRAFVHYRGNGSCGWLEESPVRQDVEMVWGDVRDRDLVHEAMQGVAVVFHLAALIGIPYSYRAPSSYLDTNAMGTMNVLQAARARGVGCVVQTSTSEVYGTAQRVPMSEEHPLRAQSPYAASKIAADQMAGAFAASFGLPVVIVRPFNTFGPRQSARAIVPTIAAQALAGEPIRLGNLAPIRDFTYVADTVEAFLRAAEEPAALGHVINVGSGRGISIAELASRIAEFVGGAPGIDQEAARVRPEASEVERLIADAAKARTLLGWRPLTTLEDGLQLTIAWMREHHHAYRPELYAI